jgi:hypothetical protein
MGDMLQTFNNQLNQLSQVLSNRFPANKELLLTSTSIRALSKCNKNKPIELFTLYVYRYRELIVNKQESLILSTDFTSDLNKQPGSHSFNIMINLKDCWKSLTDDEKVNIWTYLQVLIKLTDKHIGASLNKPTVD